MQRLLWWTLPLGLACGGIPTPEATPVLPPEVHDATTPPPEVPTPEAPDTAAPKESWVDTAVAEALEWEIMPGTSGGDADGTRAEELRKFFVAHPEYEDATRREALAQHACGLGTEATHEYLTKPPPKQSVEVAVVDEDWKVIVAHVDVHCTSDDWSWYTNEASEAAILRGAESAYGNADANVVIVKRKGEEVARAPLSGQGWLMLRAGKPPVDLPYDPSFTEGMDAYLGPAPE